MIKNVALLYRNPALTQEEFRDYWLNVHVPLVKAALPGLTLYKGSFPIGDGSKSKFVDAFTCDAVVELGWPDVATMKRDMSSAEFNTPEREASSAHLMDLPRCSSILVEEIEISI